MQLRLEQKAGTKFTELNDAMREHHAVFGHKLSPLPQEPVLSDFYTPSYEQHDRELNLISTHAFHLSPAKFFAWDMPRVVK